MWSGGGGVGGGASEHNPLGDDGTSAGSKGVRMGGEKRQYIPEAQDDYARQRRRTEEQHVQSPYDDKDGHYIIRLGESLIPRYKILKIIGEGTFGKVTQCWDREKKKYVAVKIIKSIQKYRDAAQVEIEILKDIHRRDVNKTSGCITLLEPFDFRNHYCLVFDLLGMSMYDFLRQNSYRPFSLNEVQIYGRQLLRTVSFLHGMNLIHTDLKLENILLVNSDWTYHRSKKHGRSRVVKCKDLVVIDLGSATYEHDHHASVVSTRHYRAPEVVLGLGWSYPCDIWSVGCILLEFLTGEATFQTHENLEHLAMMEVILGKIPYSMAIMGERKHGGNKYFTPQGDLRWPDVASNVESIKAVKRLKPLAALFDHESTEHRLLHDLVKKLLAFDPCTRIKADDALNHPFFSIDVPAEYNEHTALHYPDAPIPPSTMPKPYHNPVSKSKTSSSQQMLVPSGAGNVGAAATYVSSSSDNGGLKMAGGGAGGDGHSRGVHATEACDVGGYA